MESGKEAVVMRTCVVKVAGIVQGVSYRAYAKRCAVARKLSGYARNLSSGDVEVAMQGKKKDVEAVIEELKRGPTGSAISSVSAQWKDAPRMYGFEIR